MAKPLASPSNDLLAYMMKNLMRTDAASEKDCNLDVAELAKIFQALKFRVRTCGVFEPSVADELAADAPTGIIITVTCLNSRTQLVLQRDAHECNCSSADEDKGSWEVMATTGSRSSLIETASGMYPPLKADAASAVRGLMEHVVAVAAGKVDPPSTAIATPKWRERRSDGWQRMSLGAAETPSVFSELRAKHRSLDTLIGDDEDCSDLPKPGALLKSASSSTSTSIQIVPSSPTPRATGMMGYLRTAQDNLNKAIGLCAAAGDAVPRNVERAKTPKADSQVTGARSCPMLDGKMPPPKSSSLLRTRPPAGKLLVRPTITTTPCGAAVRTAVGRPIGVRTTEKAASTGAVKKSPNFSKKYAHIKSTIPKPSAK